MHAHAAQCVRQFGIVGEDRSAVAVAAERLGGEETGRRREAEGTQPPPFVGRAETLRGIIQNEHALGRGNRRNRIMIGGLTEQIDGNDGFGLEALLFRDRDAALSAKRCRY